jgi:hypothetical protein
VSLPALILLTMVALAAVAAVLTRLQCVDAAREAARAAARGESGATAGARVAPAGATVTLVADGSTVRAVVSASVRPLGGRLPGFAVTATAVAAVEPGVSAP